MTRNRKIKHRSFWLQDNQRTKPDRRSRSVGKRRFRRTSLKIPSTENIGVREIFREARRVTSFVTRRQRRGGAGKFAGTLRITAVKLDTHYNPIKSPDEFVTDNQTEVYANSPSSHRRERNLYTRSRSRDIEKFARPDLFRDHFPSFYVREPSQIRELR